MSGFGGTNWVSPTNSINSSYKHSSDATSEGKLKNFSVKGISIKNLMPSAKGALKQGIKSLFEFSSIVAVPSSQRYLTKPAPKAEGVDTLSQSNESVPSDKDTHDAILASRLVDKQSTDLQIKTGQKTKGWRELDKIANPKNKKTISDNGFSRLISLLNQKDISRNNDLKLMVLFAAHNFENNKLSPNQMKQYMDVLVNKYTTARAEEQVRVSVLTLAPTGSERKGFGGDRPLKASESVQVAELLATAGDRLDATDATDDDSGVVHNYKRDFPLSLYGWELDFENISKAVDSKLLSMLPHQLKNSLTQEASGQDFVNESDFEDLLVEGIHRSIDEFMDSLLRSARSRVDSPVKKDKSVLESAGIIKGKLTKRREQLVSVLQVQLGKAFANQAMEMPIEKIVDHKIALWVKEYETPSHENDFIKGTAKSKKTTDDEMTDAIRLESIKVNIEDSDLPADKSVEEWADLLLSHYSKDEEQLIDKVKLMDELAKKALEMDIKDGLILPEDSKSTFVRGSPLRRAKRWDRPNVYKLSVPVTDVLKEALIRNEGETKTQEIAYQMDELDTQGRVRMLINRFEKLIKEHAETAMFPLRVDVSKLS